MIILCILDGYGLRKDIKANAIALAKKKNLDKLFNEYNMVEGNASGLDVGLPDKQMGNSEVGHLNIGSGRIVYQDLTRINKSIEDYDFFSNKEFLKATENCKKNNSSLHIMGLLSDGGVHTHNSHLYALIELAKREGIKKVYIHCFMDGRDTKPGLGKKYLIELEEKLKNSGVGKIATICGRYYAMDRDKNYDRIELAYNLLTKGEGKEFDSSIEAFDYFYNNNITDEFIKPSVIKNENTIDSTIKDNDSIIFFNFRPDRARQITRAFVEDDFTYFNRKKLNNIVFVCMTEYDINIKNKLVAFSEKQIKNHLGECISKNNLKQLRIAETEKYAHVTFFLNGGVEAPYKNEDRILIPSTKEVPTYDLKPEMSAYEITKNVVEAIYNKNYDLIIVNFANADMVGHTGNLEACIKAIEVIDDCIGQIATACESVESNLFIISDHGNAEIMQDDEGKALTSHTNNKVPFCLISKEHYKLKQNGKLSDVAPTILELMNIKKPEEMTGESLII